MLQELDKTLRYSLVDWMIIDHQFGLFILMDSKCTPIAITHHTDFEVMAISPPIEPNLSIVRQHGSWFTDLESFKL